ncbi:cell wall protein Ecm33 [Coniosporium tulheliwenetii]|uniref:Cell wall protein Ecm33 n=1 Tax=Coniosporium tulheliwenetii TaxID=3383036 RepID=A0ACC2Z508_9PEZI|nr:cell wall protein Ecm33 [Cladosporium sp. JES 115]
MSVLRYALPVLAVAGSVAAQCSAATTTIQNSGDASALARCSTFSGSVAIATGTTDTLRIPSVRRITGDVIAENVAGIPSLEASDLEAIEGSFTLTNLTILSNLNMPRLTDVSRIIWEGLPNLPQLSFTSQVKTALSVSIQNTFLSSLEGINLETVESFVVANNGFLNEINLQLANVSEQFTLEANGPQLVVALPNLIWGNEMNFLNCSSVNIQSLQTTNGSLGFYSNFFTEISAPNLTELSNITFPQLRSVGGGLLIANNSQLENINGFPALETIGGALDFNGQFNNVELPELNNVRGAFNLQSTEDIQEDCDAFRRISGPTNIIKGKFQCAGRQTNPGGAGTTPTSGSSGSSASGAAGHLDISSSTVMGVSGVLAAIFGLL